MLIGSTCISACAAAINIIWSEKMHSRKPTARGGFSIGNVLLWQGRLVVHGFDCRGRGMKKRDQQELVHNLLLLPFCFT